MGEHTAKKSIENEKDIQKKRLSPGLRLGDQYIYQKLSYKVGKCTGNPADFPATCLTEPEG
jgi:hypothetical protein